jgi:hypothetical protein
MGNGKTGPVALIPAVSVGILGMGVIVACIPS